MIFLVRPKTCNAGYMVKLILKYLAYSSSVTILEYAVLIYWYILPFIKCRNYRSEQFLFVCSEYINRLAANDCFLHMKKIFALCDSITFHCEMTKKNGDTPLLFRHYVRNSMPWEHVRG
jgi:hypothetical protein